MFWIEVFTDIISRQKLNQLSTENQKKKRLKRSTKFFAIEHEESLIENGYEIDSNYSSVKKGNRVNFFQLQQTQQLKREENFNVSKEICVIFLVLILCILK